MTFTPLPTDYTNAVWNGFKKYNQIDNDDGTVSFQDVTVYTKREKSFFGAKDANQINQAVNDVMAKVKEYDDFKNSFVADNAGAHNSIYRGQHMGDFITPEQHNAISNGTFEDLYIGDYWTIGDVNYRIAAFDYYYNRGDVSCDKHHVLIVPDTPFYEAQMHKTKSGKYETGDTANTTAGGYVGSSLYKQGLASALNTVKSAFGENVLNHRVMLTNAVSNGVPSAGAWCDEEINLMTEEMVYGCPVLKPMGDGKNHPYHRMLEIVQLPLFRFNVSLICIGVSWWLRDVYSSSAFTIVSSYGTPEFGSASSNRSVRPYFCIC